MIKAIIIRIVLYGALAYAFTILCGKPAHSESLVLDEPAISVYQGTEKGTQVIVLQWPNGKTERLVVKKGEEKEWLLWFRERLDSHDKGE